MERFDGSVALWLVGGLPAHPMVVHGAVAFVALLAAATIVLALLRPALLARWAWPLTGVALALLVLVQLSMLTGEQLEDVVVGEGNALIEAHESAAKQLRLALGALTALLAVTGWRLRRQAGDVSAAISGPAGATLRAGAVLAAALTLAALVQTGHTGAESVWLDQVTEEPGADAAAVGSGR